MRLKSIKSKPVEPFFVSLEAGWDLSYSRWLIAFGIIISVVCLLFVSLFVFLFSEAISDGDAIETVILAPPMVLLIGYFPWVYLVRLRPMLLGNVVANAEFVEFRPKGKSPTKFLWGDIQRVYTSPATNLCHISGKGGKIIMGRNFKGFVALRSALEFAAEVNRSSRIDKFRLDELKALVFESSLTFEAKNSYNKIEVAFALLAFLISPFLLSYGLDFESEMNAFARGAWLVLGIISAGLLPMEVFQLSRKILLELSPCSLSLRQINRFTGKETDSEILDWADIKFLDYPKWTGACLIAFRDESRPAVFLDEKINGFFPVTLLAEALFLEAREQST